MGKVHSWVSALAAKLHYTRLNAVSGVLIYATGDLVASLITRQVSISRIVGMALLGGTLYAIEIPNWFRLIDRWTVGRKPGLNTSLWRTFFAICYFNPLWIARHLLFVNLFAGQWSDITWQLIPTALTSFAANIPITIIGNYLIQNRLSFKWRFFGSRVFSSLMAIYYAMSEVWFR